MSVDTFPSRGDTEVMTTDQKIEAAWEHYAPLGSEEYFKLNNIKRETKKILSYHHGAPDHQIVIIGSVNIDPKTGESISGHDLHPEARSMVDIETEFKEYQSAVTEAQRIIIFEGSAQPEHATDRSQAISLHTESGLLQWLAQEHQVPAETGEPEDEVIAAAMEEASIDRPSLAALYVVRSLSSRADLGDIGPYLAFHAAQVGVDGFRKFSEAEKQQLEESGGVEAVMNELTEKVISKLLPKFNELVGHELFVVKDGKVTIDVKSDFGDRDSLDQELMPLWEPNGSGPINQMSKQNSTLRDRFLFEKIIKLYESGKSPFIAYGGSHVACLEPALRAYFEINP